MTDQKRNLNPHAEARLAMCVWSHEYAHEQKGGSMDFWDAIGPNRREVCRSMLNEILAAEKQNGRAPETDFAS